jgi:hypothetical protein
MNIEATWEDLDEQRCKDWRALLAKQGKLQRLGAIVFNGQGKREEDTNAAFMCSKRELQWAKYKEKEGTLIFPIAELLGVAIQQQGLPSKLSIPYRGRFVVGPRGEVRRELMPDLARVGPERIPTPPES